MVEVDLPSRLKSAQVEGKSGFAGILSRFSFEQKALRGLDEIG
jgi:hypothetical protein